MATKLDVNNTIDAVILGEIKELIYYPHGSYIKFQLIVTAIEFLGACMDQHKYTDRKLSEDRFNRALTDLFPKKYHKYAKGGTPINLFDHLRCGMVHRLSPDSQGILLTERKHIKDNHHSYNMVEKDNKLYIVLEDFYDDLEKACYKLKDLNAKGKLPTKKMESGYLIVYDLATIGDEIKTNEATGHTISNSTTEKALDNS